MKLGKKVLVYAYFAKNFGDDLFLKILFDRYPDVEWRLLTANRNYKEIFGTYKNVKIIYSYREVGIGRHQHNIFFKLNDLFFNYKKYDAFVNIGGSLFMQGPAWKMKLREREYLVKNFKKSNKKAFILGANFGPYQDKQFVKQYRKLFHEIDDICFRDTHSYNIFRNLDNVRVASDIVFTLETKSTVKKEKSVGFSIIDLEKRKGLNEYYKQYNEKMVRLAEDYIEKGYKINLFSFCENEGDLKGIKFITDNINPEYREHIKVFSYNGDIDIFLNDFKSCEIIVGTRFHSIILAMLFNQKFYPIIYNEKTYNLLKDLKKEKISCHLKDIGSLKVKEAIAAIENNKIDGSNLFLGANKQFEIIDQLLTGAKYKKEREVIN